MQAVKSAFKSFDKGVRALAFPPSPTPVSLVAQLAESHLDGAEAALKDLFAWERERALHFAGGAFKVAALILTPLLAAALNPADFHAARGTVHVYWASAALASLVGLTWLGRSALLEREYRETVILFDLLRRALGRQ